MNALILASLLAAQNCPNGVCPVPTRTVVVTQTAPPPLAVAPRSTPQRLIPVLDRRPVLRFAQGDGPVRNTLRRLFR